MKHLLTLFIGALIFTSCQEKTIDYHFTYPQGKYKALILSYDDGTIEDIQVAQLFDKHNAYYLKFLTLSPRVNQKPPEIPPAIKFEMKRVGMDPASFSGSVHDIREAMQKYKRKNQDKLGKDYSDLTDEQLTDDYHYMIFPNVTLNCHSDDLWVFRQRPHPTDPNKMFFDFQNFELMNEEEHEEWKEKNPERVKHDQFKHGDKSPGLVIKQDAFNLPRVQNGMKSAGFDGLWIGEQEMRIRHMHKTLDTYINGNDKK